MNSIVQYMLYTILVYIYMQHIKREHLHDHRNVNATRDMEKTRNTFCLMIEVYQSKIQQRPNLEGEIRREDRPEKNTRRRHTTKSNSSFGTKRNSVSSFEVPCVKWNLNMLSFCHGMKEIKHVQYMYQYV